MASAGASDSDREYRLIEQLELRIAGAASEEKFEAILQKFFAALILKLAADNTRNRNLAVKVCQYINQRIKINTSIKLPVSALLKVFRETDNSFVKRFSLLFIEQGLSRQSLNDSIEALPQILQSSIPESDDPDAIDQQMWSVTFDYLLDTLHKWKVPDHGSKEDDAMTKLFNLSNAQLDCLIAYLGRFLLYDPKSPQSQSNDDAEFLAVFEKQFKTRSGVAAPIAKFTFTSIFSDQQRLIPATILSVDSNAAAFSLSDIMFKQCTFDFESDATVDALFSLYRVAKPKLQTKILSLLCRSQKATSRTEEIQQIVEKQLNADTTGLEASKLRSAIFSFLTWTVRVGHNLGGIGPKLQELLKDFIELQGWPTISDPSMGDIELRGKAYESIGLLAATRKQTDSMHDLSPGLALISWLFTSLRCDTTRDIRASIEEALGRVMNVAFLAVADDVEQLKDLLLWNTTAKPGDEDPIYFFASQISTRYPAVRFANKCLPFEDIEARYIDILALESTERREVIEEGERGLDPYWHASNIRLTSTSPTAEQNLRMPHFGELVRHLFGSDRLFQNGTCKVPLPVLLGAVTFSRNVLVDEALKGTDEELAVEPDWKTRIDAVITNNGKARDHLRRHIRLVSQHNLVQLLEAAVHGLSMGSLECAEIASELIGLSSDEVHLQLQARCADAIAVSLTKAKVQYHAARISGIFSSLTVTYVSSTDAAIDKCTGWRSAVGQEAVKVQGTLLNATFTTTRAFLRGETSSDALSDKLWSVVAEIAVGSPDKLLRDTAHLAIGQIALCCPSQVPLHRDQDKVIDHMMAEAKKENEAAVTALGRLVGSLAERKQEGSVDEIVERMFALHEVRKAEFHFALGEAFAVASVGFHSTSTMTDFDIDSPLPSTGAHYKLLDKIILRSVESCKSTKPSMKKAAAIWLLCLLQYCENAAPIKAHLRDCQAAFARLLTDRDEIVQETGSRGLSLVYEKGDTALRDDLVRDLVQSFTGSNTKMSGTVNEDTQLFEAGALPTENGQSVTTYKDIVSLATEMGDPSLVYRFMNLASNNAIWTSRAAFGRFGLGNVLADSTYLTENKKFYPKLFRYRFDPNPNVQRSMNDIWRALVKDPNAVIDQNFDLIMNDLLKSIVLGKEWRAREASCAAIADLVQGRDVEKYEKFLDQIWGVAFKVLDDMKETVRVAAMKLCRTLTSMLIRNLEVGEGTTKRAVTMLNHAMPFLLQQMDNGGAKEVQQYAIITLLEVVKKAPAKSLRIFAPVILETLINSLSSLEHESINYLHLNADKYGLTAEGLDKMRVSSINASPVTEAIERCLDSLSVEARSEAVGEDVMEGIETDKGPLPDAVTDAMLKLEGTFKTAIGLPSKVGLSRVIVTLVVRHHAIFRPYADRFLRLTRKTILDRNATISVAFSMSLAYLMRLASDQEIRDTNRFAQKLYFESQELAHRSVAGEIIQAIAKTSNDVFMRFAPTFLPFAFVGRSDTDAEVRERFDPAWKENVGGSRAINLYLKEIAELISTHIHSSLWPIRHGCCLAVADLITSMEVQYQYAESEANIIWPLLEVALAGKTWDGKEKIISVYPKFVRQARTWAQQKGAASSMKAIALREAKRTNAAYRPHALRALGGFATSSTGLDLGLDVMPLLREVVDEMTEEDAMETDVDDAQGSHAHSAVVDATLGSAVTCVFDILSPRPEPDVLDTAIGAIRKAHTSGSKSVDLAIYDGATSWLQRFDADSARGKRRTATAIDEGRVATAELIERLEAFSEQLVLALLDNDRDSARYATEHETLRKSRVGFAAAVARSGQCSQATHGRLAGIFARWMEAERSRSLRAEVEAAAEANRLQLSTAS